jgi:ATPase
MSSSSGKHPETYVLDTSIIIDGKASELVDSGEIANGSKIVVPIAALDELQAQASKNREEGFVGLTELTRLRKSAEQKDIGIEFTGERPTMEDIRLARNGRIDAIIRDVAKKMKGTLLTADYVQALVGSAEGVKVRHFPSAEIKTTGLTFERFFDGETMSLHLKEGIFPHSKRGRPGEFVYSPIRNSGIMNRQDLEAIVKEITEAARISAGGSVEISRSGATVIQLGKYRIAVTRPPFSDALELTIVKPLVRLSLGDYKISPKLEDRLRSHAEGILIAGPPGSGKSTLASAMADYYATQGKVVKTFESPRDLQVSEEVSQYGPLEGDFEKTAEILLLVRPDYTIFDEVRKTRDFQVFSDMRLAGVGMVGVVHASDPVNAVQRFMSRMELGMVPHVVDTVIFVKNGRIEQVLELKLVVKVPSGMTEPDLSRPVVEVRDYETGKLEFEIYTFGEENVVVPLGEATGDQARSSGVDKLAEERILESMRKFDPDALVKIVSRNRAEVQVDESVIPRIIGRGGSNVKNLEQALSIRLDIKPRAEGYVRADRQNATRGETNVDILEKGSSVLLSFPQALAGSTVTIMAGDELLFEDVVGKGGKIALGKKTPTGKRLRKLHRAGVPIVARVSQS